MLSMNRRRTYLGKKERAKTKGAKRKGSWRERAQEKGL
jgi:hypothetical protein